MEVKTIYFDDVVQVFRSEDNFCFILGASNGAEDESGNSLSDPVAKIVFPRTKITLLLEALRKGETLLWPPTEGVDQEVQEEPKIAGQTEFEGSPVVARARIR
jgi:hypothetical protein